MEKALQEFLDTTVLKTPQNYVQNLLKTVHSKNITLEDWNTFVKQLDSLIKQNSDAYTGFQIINNALQNISNPDVNLPYVGENGNWFFWDETSGSYIDSNIPAKGFDIEVPSGIFIATYGQTLYSEILTAWKSGSLVVLKGDVESALTVRMLVHVSTDKIFFGRVLAESKLVEEVIVTKSDSWSLIKNNYLTKDDLANISTGIGSKTVTRVFQTGSSGTIRCKPNTTYNFYCVDDTEATLRGYGTQNADKELSGKYLTVHCGSKNDSFTDGKGTTITGSAAALWYATSMTKGTITPVGSMTVKRGVLEHSDGKHYIEISYPADCSVIITENVELLSANGVSF